MAKKYWQMCHLNYFSHPLAKSPRLWKMLSMWDTVISTVHLSTAMKLKLAMAFKRKSTRALSKGTQLISFKFIFFIWCTIHAVHFMLAERIYSSPANCGTHTITRTWSFRLWRKHWRIWRRHILICIWFIGHSHTKMAMSCSRSMKMVKSSFPMLISPIHGKQWRRPSIWAWSKALAFRTLMPLKPNAFWTIVASNRW